MEEKCGVFLQKNKVGFILEKMPFCPQKRPNSLNIQINSMAAISMHLPKATNHVKNV